MNKIKRILVSPYVTIVMFMIAIAFLGVGAIGGARAALTYYSETYASQVEMRDIGVTLVENGEDISNRDYDYDKQDGSWKHVSGALLSNMLTESDNKFVLGKTYTEKLAAKNSGTIDSYVRATVYKYWVDKDDKKIRMISPSTINLHLVNLYGGDGDQCWIEDEAAKTEERTVLYYRQLLNSGSMTADFSDTIQIDGNIVAHVKTEKNGNTTTTMYDYQGNRFVLEVTIDAVQDHNAEAAILSAWGKRVSVDEKSKELRFAE